MKLSELWQGVDQKFYDMVVDQCQRDTWLESGDILQILIADRLIDQSIGSGRAMEAVDQLLTSAHRYTSVFKWHHQIGLAIPRMAALILLAGTVWKAECDLVGIYLWLDIGPMLADIDPASSRHLMLVDDCYYVARMVNQPINGEVYTHQTEYMSTCVQNCKTIL